MPREIKFRVWDKNNKVMLDSECPGLAITLDGEISRISEELEWEGTYYSEGKYELMQYIGLRDKNGKEVYEGDIVKFTERDYEDCSREELISEETSIQVVAYDYHSFGLRPHIEDMPLRPFIWLIGCDYDIEVIGNIYENPELIKAVS